MTRDGILLHRTSEFNRLRSINKPIADKLISYTTEKLKISHAYLLESLNNLYQDFLKVANTPINKLIF